MNIAVIYIYPLGGAGEATPRADRFIHSWAQYPAGAEHQLYVVCNGFAANERTRKLFEPIGGCLVEHDNSGYDIGAFQRAAREIPADLMVFFGSSAYLRGPNWLARMAQAYEKHGNILYGSMEHTGVIQVGVWPHIRTTGFWMNPQLLNSYPIVVRHPSQRYPFEHGPQNLTLFCMQQGGAKVVTWDAEYDQPQWGRFPEGYHRGRQSAMITGDKNSAPPYHGCA